MKTLITLAAVLGWSLQANAYTIDFEEFAPGTELLYPGIVSGDYLIDADYSSEGGPYTSAGAHITSAKALSIFGDMSIFATYAEVSVERTDGGSFALWSMDVEEFGYNSSPIFAKTSAGNFIYGGLADLGQGDWLDIVSFTYNTQQAPGTVPVWLTVDNIVVSAVPVPAAVWLFGSGLTALGLWRRRKS